MESLTQSHRILRFGVYEADLAAGELRKHGTRIKIQEQPFQILLVLLEHPGELVTRDLLREKLWANDTFVDFDRSLNTAVTKLRTALCDSADNPRFIQTIPRQGYRFIAPVASQFVAPIPREMAAATPAPTQISIAREVEHRSRTINTARISYALAAFTIIVLVGAMYYVHSRTTRNLAISSTAARRSVAVLSFKNLTGDSSHAWLSAALSDWLSAELAAGEQLRTIPEENVARMRVELALPEVDSLSKDTLQRIRQNLGADLVVTGSYASLGKTGDQIRVDAHLQDAATGETVGTISQAGTEDQLLDLISRTGQRLRASAGVHPATPQESAAVAVVLPSNPNATRSYSEGLARLRLYDASGARDLFQKTVAIEPGFALGHSALSTAWSRLGYDRNAIEEGKKASDLSGSLPRAERLLVQARYQEASKHWEQAIQTYRTLSDFFPDNIDYGLALAQAQTSGGKGRDALGTISSLHALPAPVGADPRVDLAEANAADSLGDLKHALASADNAIEKARSAGASLLVADALMVRSHMLQGFGRLSEASTALQEAQRILQAAGDKDKLARAEAQSAHLVDIGGDFSSAKTMYEASLAIFREIGDQEQAAIELNNVGVELQNMGDLAAAKQNFAEALKASSGLGDQWTIAIAQANLAEILFDLGDLSAAKQSYDGSLANCRAIGNRDMEAYVLSGIGRVLHAQGDLNAALEDEKRAVSTFEEIGQIHTDANVALVDVLLDLGRAQEADSEARKALQILKNANSTNDQPLMEAALANALLAQGEIVEARKASEDAASLGKGITTETRLIVETVRARVLTASNESNDKRQAESMFHDLLTESTRIGLLGQQFEARLGSAELDLSSGNAAIGRTKLAALEKDAKRQGWLSTARKAALDLNAVGSSTTSRRRAPQH